MSTMNLRQEFAELLRTTNIPASADVNSKIEKYSRLNTCIMAKLPMSLFRYRSTEAHNIDALRNGQINVTKPSEMGDIFDSLIPVDAERVVEKIKQLEGGFDGIAQYLFQGGTIPDWALCSVSRDMRRTIVNNKSNFKNLMKSSRFQHFVKTCIPQLEQMILKKINDKSGQSINVLKNTGYIACMCEAADNLKMWSDYADKHRGYVLEYDFEALNPRFHTFDKNDEQFQPESIVLPVIYGEQYDSTDLVINITLNELLRGISAREYYIRQQDELWHIKGYLYKSADYESEAEWRLITPIQGVPADAKSYSNVKGNPKAIYYGAKMSDDVIAEIEEIICNRPITRYRMRTDNTNAHVVAEPML